MNIDREVVEAINQTVERAGQNGTLAKLLTEWVSSVAGGNESLAELESVQRRLDLLLENIQVDIETAGE